MSVPLLEVERLSVSYGRVLAVSEVSLAVPEGAIVTILGPNGAGKSTLLNALMGLLPARGAVRFRGASLAGRAVEGRVADGLVLVPEKRELFTTMSVEDNLRLGGFRRRASAETTLGHMFELFPRLAERRNQVAGTLSGGERQMLATARALMSRPKLLMLDEPSLGLAPLVVRDILLAVANLRREGVSVLLVEQNARAALNIADYGFVLENGRTVLQGPAAALREDERVIAAYLGTGQATGAGGA